MLGKTLLQWLWSSMEPIQKTQVGWQRSHPYLMLALCWSLIWGYSSSAIAQPRRQPPTNPVPARLQTLLENRPAIPRVTADTPSQKGFTVPSLWWTSQQFGEKLVQNWQAYGTGQVGSQQINVIVRPELWTRYTYFERYGFLLKFGRDASHFGYQLLVFDAEDFLLGAYTCDFAQSDPKFISGVVDARSQPIPKYGGRGVTPALPCRVWLSPNYPSGTL